ncbi:Alpha/Beta hydrolase protein, partial [Cunninghamella echinulata]
AILILLTFPTPQKFVIYLHWLQVPWSPNFHLPVEYGFPNNAVRNIRIPTIDNITLGAWHILPNEYHAQYDLRNKVGLTDNVFDQALQDEKYDTVIYFHGNAMSRVAPWRIDLYKNLRLKFPRLNIIAIDYRGFGDSEGTPSENGLHLDAKSTYNWLISKNVSPSKISLIGHSLGTGVATHLAYDLTKLGTPPKSLILQAAYSSLPNLIFEYRILEIVPILAPLKWSSRGKEWMLSKLNHIFDSYSYIKKVDCPILIVYGAYDLEIPVDHSKQLFFSALGSDDQYNEDWLLNNKEIKINEINSEATVYTILKANKSIKLVNLHHANHNNLGYFDYLYQSIQELTHWSSLL